jgi:NADH:ubiquinone oxidoreductase subunit H
MRTALLVYVAVGCLFVGGHSARWWRELAYWWAWGRARGWSVAICAAITAGSLVLDVAWLMATTPRPRSDKS